MNKVLIGSILTIIIAIGGTVMLFRSYSPTPQVNQEQENITLVDGKQLIAITAKGGYSPRLTKAKANTPTTINLLTNGSYDCSIAFTMPALGIRKDLPATGVTPIEIPPQEPGATIKGLCSMGMYYFTIAFN